MIKKMFSILMGILMALPLLFVAPTLCYYAFNENCEAQTTTITTTNTQTIDITATQQGQITYAETNSISSVSNFVVNNVYHYDGLGNWQGVNNSLLFFFKVSYINSSLVSTTYDTNNNDYLKGVNGSLKFYHNSNVYDLSAVPFDFVVTVVGTNTSYMQYITNNISHFGSSAHLVATGSSSSNIVYEGEYTTTDTLTDVTTNDITSSVNVAFNKVYDLPLFSWVKNSPIYSTLNGFNQSYLNMPSNSPFTQLLTYWIILSCVYLIGMVVLLLPSYTAKQFFDF